MLPLLRIRDARLRLYVWQFVILLSFLAPLVSRWQGAPVLVAQAAVSAGEASWNWRGWLLAALGAGILLRSAWLLIGLVRLRVIRMRAVGWRPDWYDALMRKIGVTASIAASGDVDGAVTFGVRRPAILVPTMLTRA